MDVRVCAAQSYRGERAWGGTRDGPAHGTAARRQPIGVNTPFATTKSLLLQLVLTKLNRALHELTRTAPRLAHEGRQMRVLVVSRRPRWIIASSLDMGQMGDRRWGANAPWVLGCIW